MSTEDTHYHALIRLKIPSEESIYKIKLTAEQNLRSSNLRQFLLSSFALKFPSESNKLKAVLILAIEETKNVKLLHQVGTSVPDRYLPPLHLSILCPMPISQCFELIENLPQ